MEFTIETFKNPKNDHELTQHIQNKCDSFKLDLDEIRQTSSEKGATEIKIISTAQAQFSSKLVEKKSLDEWLESFEKKLPIAQKNEDDRRKELEDYRKKGGGKPIPGEIPAPILLYMKGLKSVSIVLVAVGYVTSALMLLDVVPDWYSAFLIPFAVLIGGGIVYKLFLANLADHLSKNQWNIVFYITTFVAFIALVVFIYIISVEGGQPKPEDFDTGLVGEGNESKLKTYRIFSGIIFEILGAALAWAFAEKLGRQYVNEESIILRHEYQTLSEELKKATAEKDLIESRMSLGETLLEIIRTANNNIQSEALRVYGEVTSKIRS